MGESAFLYRQLGSSPTFEAVSSFLLPLLIRGAALDSEPAPRLMGVGPGHKFPYRCMLREVYGARPTSVAAWGGAGAQAPAEVGPCARDRTKAPAEVGSAHSEASQSI